MLGSKIELRGGGTDRYLNRSLTVRGDELRASLCRDGWDEFGFDAAGSFVDAGLDDLPESIRAGDPPRLKSPAEYSAEDYNTIADAYGVATGKVPGTALLQDRCLAEYSERHMKALFARQAEGKEGLKSKLGIE